MTSVLAGDVVGVGPTVGTAVGWYVGEGVGSAVGTAVGWYVGEGVGWKVGEGVGL